jgi:hypothetical protein
VVAGDAWHLVRQLWQRRGAHACNASVATLGSCMAGWPQRWPEGGSGVHSAAGVIWAALRHDPENFLGCGRCFAAGTVLWRQH